MPKPPPTAAILLLVSAAARPGIAQESYGIVSRYTGNGGRPLESYLDDVTIEAPE